MRRRLDRDAKLSFACQECGRELVYSIGELEHEDDLVCAGCGWVLHDTSLLRNEIEKADKLFDKISRGILARLDGNRSEAGAGGAHLLVERVGLVAVAVDRRAKQPDSVGFELPRMSGNATFPIPGEADAARG